MKYIKMMVQQLETAHSKKVPLLKGAYGFMDEKGCCAFGAFCYAFSEPLNTRMSRLQDLIEEDGISHGVENLDVKIMDFNDNESKDHMETSMWIRGLFPDINFGPVHNSVDKT